MAEMYIEFEQGFCNECFDPVNEDTPICSCYHGDEQEGEE